MIQALHINCIIVNCMLDRKKKKDWRIGGKFNFL